MTWFQFFALFGLPTIVVAGSAFAAWLHVQDLKKKEHRH